MVLLDIGFSCDAQLARAARQSAGGALVYSLIHPCWVAGASLGWAVRRTVELREYLQLYELHGGVGGSINYHRPLADYLNETVRLGCYLTEVVEPGLSPEQIDDPDEEIPRPHP